MSARLRLVSLAAFVLTGLVTLASLAGLAVSSVYAKETASWAAQGVGQDWIDLLVVAPVLATCGFTVRRGSRGALLVLAGTLIYLVYSFVLYAFAVHFNVLFLVYCATLGVSFYALLAIAIHLQHEHATEWFRGQVPFTRFGGVFLIVTAIAFYALWLSSVIPALVRGAPPAELEEVGLTTNPVHVLDLAVVLPAILASGVLLLRRRGPGLVLGPIVAAFNALMTLALIGMMVTMHQRGLTADPSVVVMMAVMSAISVFLLIVFMRPLRRFHLEAT